LFCCPQEQPRFGEQYQAEEDRVFLENTTLMIVIQITLLNTATAKIK